ncbi:MAG TPA: hypothetical protein VKQ08_06015 [Cyclobacteriaceae bacterium]|nr:hypothetical protein [Cyclobacteriaceae bacterium]
MNTTKNICIKTGAALIFLLASSILVYAQNNKLETDKGIAAAIAAYDADVRFAILQASQYPQVLMQLQKNQTETMTSFQRMVGKFRRKKQEWFYTLTRYPDLVHKLANLPRGQSQNAVYKLLPNQNPDLQEAAWKLYKGEQKSLAKVDNLRIAAEQEFDQRISHVHGAARDAFHRLHTMPDVLTLLTNNIDLTTRLGEHYRNNPAQVSNSLTALHDNLEVQNEQEVASFKKQMESDPKAMKELNEAASAYSSYGYNNPYYYGYPYSYWFGYPYWYPYPMWYPGVYWYGPGFYFGIGGLYGFPSYGFSFWFYNGGYYQRYPNLYRRFGTYYRTNIVANRMTTTVNRGFMGVANAHYTGGVRLKSLTSPSLYSRQSGQFRQSGSTVTRHVNANIYHAQSWGGAGARPNALGGFHGGISRGGGRR